MLIKIYKMASNITNYTHTFNINANDKFNAYWSLFLA